MKDIKEVLKNRRSYRDYNGKEVSDGVLNEAIELAQRTATSINGQQVSIVVTRDKNKLEEISKINWNQEHIKNASAFLTFVVDYNRADEVINKNNKEMIHQNDVESILVGAVDAGLVSQSIELILQAQGIGTCQIGGIRQDIKKMSEILNITGKAFPVLGMTIGYEDDFENDELNIRPRVDSKSFYFKEAYDENTVRDEAIKYNDVLTKWWINKNVEEYRTYEESMSSFYTQYYISSEFEDLQDLGFLNKYSLKD